MGEILKFDQKAELPVDRKSSLKHLRLAEKQSSGKLREIFGQKVAEKNGEIKTEPIKAMEQLKEGERLVFNLNEKENRAAYYNIRLKELLPSYVKKIKVRQHARGSDGIATLKNGEYYFSNGRRAEVFKTEVTILNIEKNNKRSLDITKDNLENIAQTETGRRRLRAYALAANGRVLITRHDPLYNYFKIHYLYRGPEVKEIFINNKKAVWAEGKEGWTYYWASDKNKLKRAYFFSGDIILKELPVSRVNLDKIAGTEQGRERLRILALDKNGKVIINSANPLYFGFRIHHLYKDVPIWVNGKKALYGDGAEGKTYYYESDSKKTSRVLFYTGDIITTKPQKAGTALAFKKPRQPALSQSPKSPAEEVEVKKITARNIENIAKTEKGRTLLRKLALDANGVVIMKKSPLYNAYRIHYLYRDIPIWINGRKAVYRNGGDGISYYYENDTTRKHRAYFFTGDIITTQPLDENFLSENLTVKIENLWRIARTEKGRERLRKYCLDDEGKFKLKSTDPIYGYIQLHHLYRDKYVWKNRRKCVLRGNSYYYVNSPSDKVQFRTNDYLSTKEKRNSLGFTPEEEERLSLYTRYGHIYEKQHQSSRFRTLKNRLEDHEILLQDLFNNKPELAKLKSVLFPTNSYKPFFIDIGPGLADIDNADKYEVGGRGTPAVTSAEMAEKFPHMPVVALDLPEAVDVFMGKKSARDRYNKPYKIGTESRNKLLKNKNLHVVSGNGLESLKSQWQNPETNPIKQRRRPGITKETTIFIRAANSIDIFCSWYAKNGKSPSLREALQRMAVDFKDNPVMLFFSKEIMVKPAGSAQWTIIGKSSDMGFNHRYYSRLDRNGKPPYSFNKDRIDNLQ